MYLNAMKLVIDNLTSTKVTERKVNFSTIHFSALLCKYQIPKKNKKEEKLLPLKVMLYRYHVCKKPHRLAFLVESQGILVSAQTIAVSD